MERTGPVLRSGVLWIPWSSMEADLIRLLFPAWLACPTEENTAMLLRLLALAFERLSRAQGPLTHADCEDLGHEVIERLFRLAAIHRLVTEPPRDAAQFLASLVRRTWLDGVKHAARHRRCLLRTRPSSWPRFAPRRVP